jgi:hypothetical protein
MNKMRNGCIHNIPGWGNSEERRGTDLREIKTNGWEKEICEYSGRCEHAKDPDYFFTRCINNGEGCEYNSENKR